MLTISRQFCGTCTIIYSPMVHCGLPVRLLTCFVERGCLCQIFGSLMKQIDMHFMYVSHWLISPGTQKGETPRAVSHLLQCAKWSPGITPRARDIRSSPQEPFRSCFTVNSKFRVSPCKIPSLPMPKFAIKVERAGAIPRQQCDTHEYIF